MGVISNGTTILDAGAIDSGVATGAMTLIKTLTASSSGTLSFVDGASSVVLDGTYKEYVFKFIGIHPGTAETELTFNMSADTGSNYNVTKTTTFFRANHREDDGGSPGFESGKNHNSDDLIQYAIEEGPDFNVINGTLSMKRREGADDVLIVPQWSEDLRVWKGDGFEAIGEDPTSWKISNQVLQKEKVFYRFEVRYR